MLVRFETYCSYCSETDSKLLSLPTSYAVHSSPVNHFLIVRENCSLFALCCLQKNAKNKAPYWLARIESSPFIIYNNRKNEINRRKKKQFLLKLKIHESLNEWRRGKSFKKKDEWLEKFGRQGCWYSVCDRAFNLLFTLCWGSL